MFVRTIRFLSVFVVAAVAAALLFPWSTLAGAIVRIVASSCWSHGGVSTEGEPWSQADT